MSFSSFGLSPFLLQALTEMNYEKPTPIQDLAVPAILTGKDVLGIAPTGSGKTASYVLPILTQLSKAEKAKNRHIQSLVFVPTRELAVQVEEVFKTFARSFPEPLKVKAVYGGGSINPQMKAMMGVSILVATPGRLIELAESDAIHLSSLKSLVLDEADKFQEEVPKKAEAEKRSLEIIDAYHFLVSIAPETLEQNIEEYQETISSSMITDYQYKGLTLKVTFLNGQVFEYFGVPNNMYKKLVQSPTPERFARRHIFSSHTYRMASKATVEV